MSNSHKSKSIIITIFAGFIIFFFSTEKFNNDREQYEKFLRNEYQNLSSKSVEEIEGLPKPTYPDKAAIQNYFMTIDPNEKRVPIERLKTAYEQTLSIQKSSTLKTVSSDIQWQEVPSDIGGRTKTLMYDPNDANHSKVWGGTATGGLWYNNDITNVNSPWQPVDNFWNSLAVTAITYDPNNTQIFYAGTGEAQTALITYRESSGLGVGIYKSEDGGTNWTLLSSTADFKYITNIVVRNENGSSVIYAGVVSGFYKGINHQSSPSDGLYRSSDGGQTWEQVLPNITESDVPYAPADIKISASGRIFVGTMRNLNDEGGATILYSDEGTSGTWTIYDDYEDIIKSHGSENIPGRVVLATAPSDPNRVYAVIGAGYRSYWDQLFRSKGKFILRSTDGGGTWSEMFLPITQDYYWATIAWHCLCVIVHPESPDHVFVGGLDCYKSTNGGYSWTKLSDWRGETHQYVHGDIHNYKFNPANSDQLLVCTDGGVFMSNNSGVFAPSFVERNNSFNCLQFYTCDIDPRAGNSFYIGGLQDNGTVFYSGQPVNNSNAISGGDGAFCFIDYDNPNVIITSVYHNIYYFFNTLDDYLGSNRVYYDNGTGIFINPADYDHNQNLLYANAIAFNGQFADQLIRYRNITSNVGLGATTINITEGNSIPFSHIKVSPHTTTSSTLFVGTQAGRLFKVENANTIPSTTEIGSNNFPMGNISCVAIGGSEDSLLVTFSNYGISSVWQTYNGGSSWEEKEGNLPDMPIRWAIYHPNNAKKALIATELGVWYTDQLDQSSPEWIPVNEGLANVRVDMLKIRDTDHTVLAATHGRGLAVTTFSPVGIKEMVEQESDHIVISPNPSDGKFQFQFDTQNPGQAEITIFDMSGKQIYNEYLGEVNNGFVKNFELSSYSKGQYIIRFHFDNKIYTKKLIVF